MSTDPYALAARRQALIHQSGQLREAIAQGLRATTPWFAAADGVWSALRWAARHKLVLGAALGAGVLLRPRLGLRWVRRALLIWGTCRKAGAAWQKSLALWQRVRG